MGAFGLLTSRYMFPGSPELINDPLHILNWLLEVGSLLQLLMLSQKLIHGRSTTVV